MTEKLKILPNYEAILVTLLDAYVVGDYKKRTEMIEQIFLPLARGYDKYMGLLEELNNDDWLKESDNVD